MIIKIAFLTVLFFIPLSGLLSHAILSVLNIINTLKKILPGQTTKKEPDITWVKLRDVINSKLGLWEYYVKPLRHLLCLVWIAILGWKILFKEQDLLTGLIQMAVIWTLLSYSQNRWMQAGLKACEFARVAPSLHPRVFFTRLHQMLGPIPFTLPDARMEAAVSPVQTSFVTDHRPRQSWRILFPSLWDTIALTQLSLSSMKYVGIEYARPVFDVMASMWGKRILEITKSSLTVTGLDKIRDLKGKNILVFNHKSQLDFILTFFAMSQCRMSRGRPLKPRFIVAKDHFLDNPFVYKMMGLGRLIEAVDMVFVERNNKARGIKNLEQAAQFLIHKDIDIAIFPQGTRAEGNHDRSGKRRDAGFYTTVPPKDRHQDLGHLRKGCAHLAVDTLIGLKELGGEDQVNLIFIGIKGTATVLTKQALKMQTETDIEYIIGNPLTLSTDLVDRIKKVEGEEPSKTYLDLVESLHQQINSHLTQTLDLHAILRQRFLLDLQGHLRYLADRIESVERSFAALGKNADIVYQTLDRIYACHQSEWNTYLSQTAHLLLDGASPERLRSNRNLVTEHMLGSLTTKLHGKKVAPPSKPDSSQTATAA